MANAEQTIDKGIPAPPRFKFAFLDELQPGDSTVFAIANPHVLAAAIQYRQNRDGKRFTRRRVEGGFRVWRTA